MTPRKAPPPLDLLKSVVSYDPETGIFRWVIPIPTKKAGDRAGYRTGKYRSIKILGVCYYEHRIAWYYVTGEWPDDLDHKDRVGSHNWIDNLRVADRSKQCFNTKLYSNNTTGFRGVCFRKETGFWRAYITVKGRRRYLGDYLSPEDAAEAYDAEANSAAKEFASLNFSPSGLQP